jgi:hypothetical protein
MKLSVGEFEERFEKYRETLRQEIHRFRDAAAIFRQITEATHDHLPEINLAPGFFHVVEHSLFNTIILWADKLFDERGERGLFNFLSFIEYNREWLSVDELKRRKSYPDGHWMLQNRVPITAASIEVDREKTRSLASLASIRLRRDKFQGHFDKEYFFDRSRLQSEAAITWPELDEAAEVMGVILNDYSVDFDGAMYSWNSPSDLRRLLRAAARAKTDHGN